MLLNGLFYIWKINNPYFHQRVHWEFQIYFVVVRWSSSFVFILLNVLFAWLGLIFRHKKLLEIFLWFPPSIPFIAITKTFWYCGKLPPTGKWIMIENIQKNKKQELEQLRRSWSTKANISQLTPLYLNSTIKKSIFLSHLLVVWNLNKPMMGRGSCLHRKSLFWGDLPCNNKKKPSVVLISILEAVVSSWFWWNLRLRWWENESRS